MKRLLYALACLPALIANAAQTDDPFDFDYMTDLHFYYDGLSAIMT